MKITEPLILKQGDILIGNSSKIAEQPIWFQVLQASPQYITVRRINEQIVSGDPMSGYSTCVPNSFLGSKYTLMLRSAVEPITRASAYVKIRDMSLKLWDGQAKQYHI